MTAAAFEAHAAKTDKLAEDDLETAFLGLVGEVGSLVSALKKRRRDNDSFFGYRETVIEEFGDVLWYVAAIAKRGGTSLARIVADAAGYLGELDKVQFEDLAPRGQTAPEAFQASLLALAGEAGDLTKRFAAGNYIGNPDALRSDAVKFMVPLAEAAAAEGVCLGDAASRNISKREDRWRINSCLPPPKDDDFHIDERLPRNMRVLIYEREINGTKYVFQKIGCVLLGDRLTDNHDPNDDYRFHDVFHLAHAAVLGWSPTTRALLKIKRKSNKSIDENEDGARANLIEEGLTTWVFETAKQNNFFANTPQLGLDLLKEIKRFVRGYEADSLPMWLWESAILQGYNVFRELQLARCGAVIMDLQNRRISFEPMTHEEQLLCGLI